jgi:hypothetical protein
MMEALRSSETSVHTRATPCNIPADGILRSHRSENLKYYVDLRFIPSQYTSVTSWNEASGVVTLKIHISVRFGNVTSVA